MANGDGIRKRGNRYYPRVYLGHGRYEYLGAFATRTEARQAKREAESARKVGGDETAGDFALRWIKEYPRPKGSTRALYESLAKRFSEDDETLRVDNRLVVVPKLRLRTITRPVARAYATRRRTLHPMLRAMFNDALNDGLVSENPFARLGLPQSRGRKNIKALTEAEVTKLAECALEAHGSYGSTFRAVVLFAAYCGVRPGELMALEWGDVDFARAEVSIERRDYRGELDLPKSGVTRKIILPPPAAEALSSMPRRADRRNVFLSKRGEPIGRAALLLYWRPAWERFAGKLDPERLRELEQARGKPNMDFYELRHFCATMLLERGVSVEDTAIQLGHTDGGVQVRQTYGHPSEENARDRLRRAFDQNVTPIRHVDGEQEAANG